MPKDCGCDKEKPKTKNAWIYKKKCKILNIPDNSYIGKIGFTYYLIDNDKKKSTEYKAVFKFSNLNSGEIVYYVQLYKVINNKFDKKTNIVKKYLECVGEYSYISKLDQNKITNIINKIGNGNYDLTPDNVNKFNGLVIQNILKTTGKKSVSNNQYVRLVPVSKSYGDTACGCECVFTICESSCSLCSGGEGAVCSDTF